MKFDLTWNAESGCGVSETIFGMGLNEPVLAFERGCYGSKINKVFVVLTCRRAGVASPRRTSLDAKSKTLYVEVMLDYGAMADGTLLSRGRHVLDRLSKDLPPFMTKYRGEEFEAQRFNEDFVRWVSNYPLSDEQPKTAVEPTSRAVTDLLPISREVIGPMATRLGFDSGTYLTAHSGPLVCFQRDDDTLAVSDGFEANSVSLSSILVRNHRRRVRYLILKFAATPEGEETPVTGFIDNPLARRTVGFTSVPEPKDFRAGLIALADFANTHPTLLLPKEDAAKLKD